MNAHKVCLISLVTIGFALGTHAANAGTSQSGLDQALATIQQEQIADFHRRAIDEFPQSDVAVAEPGFADTGLADEAIAEAEDSIRLQGRLALWTIEEEQLAGYRTGQVAQVLAQQHAGVAVTTASARSESPFDKAGSLLKTSRFEWPEFIPAALR